MNDLIGSWKTDDVIKCKIPNYMASTEWTSEFMFRIKL